VTDFGRRTGAHKTTHQDGGVDEISIAGLSGQAADDQPAAAHALGGTKHTGATLAQLNAKVSDATLDDSGDTRTPTAHEASHRDGGADELVATGLVGRINLVYRGDPDIEDFTVGDFITDETWRDLSLALLVPAGAIAALIRIQVNDNDVDSKFLLRAKGNQYALNASGLRTQVSTVWIDADVIVFCDTNRVIQYFGDNRDFVGINLVIKGWFI